MKGDIAHRSISSSMSRIAEARLPRMISSVIGSTRGSAMGALQEDVVRGVDAGPEARSHQRRGVALLDDGGPLEDHPLGQALAGVGRRIDEAAAAEVDLSLIHISEPTRLLSISYAVFCLK